jgi:hypothetical protein
VQFYQNNSAILHGIPPGVYNFAILHGIPPGVYNFAMLHGIPPGVYNSAILHGIPPGVYNFLNLYSYHSAMRYEIFTFWVFANFVQYFGSPASEFLTRHTQMFILT